MAEPDSFGRYTVKERLGRGAMGVVYLAEDPVIGREVAIKVVQMPPGASERDRKEMQARFEREFRSAGTLSHPNIVTIHDVGQEDDHSFIAMEFIRGRSLQEIVHSKEILSFKDISDIGFQICSALDYAHDRGVIHRDIKPANILMTRDGQAKITDFGVAKLATGTLTRTGTIIGTPAYMSPEQVQGHTATPASDQFSVAIVLYEMLTGELPFSGDSPTTIMYKIVHEDPIHPHELNRSLPERVDNVLIRALDKSPENRYPSCTELAEAVREALGAAPMTTTVAYRSPPGTAAGASRHGARNGVRTMLAGVGLDSSRVVWIGAAAIIAVLLVGFVGWQLWPSGTPTPVDTEELTAATPDTGGEDSAEADEGSGDSGPGDTAQDTEPPTGEAAQDTEPPTVDSETADEIESTEEPVSATEEAAAAPRSLEFTIRSAPAGATVTLGGTELEEKTPTTVALQEGRRYELGIRMPGYEEESFPFQLADLSDSQLAERELFFPLRSAAPPGRVIVDASFPVEVDIVGGERYPSRERHEIELPAGAYEVTLSAPSVYFERQDLVELESGEEKTLSLPTVYEVKVIALPVGSNCRVFIDGREAGTAPLTSLAITSGYHEFRWVWSSPQETQKTETVRIDRQNQQITGTPRREAARR